MAAYDFTMDWTPLGKLGEIYQQSQQRQQLQEGLQKMGLPGNMNLAQLALQQQAVQRGETRDARDFALRERLASPEHAAATQRATLGVQNEFAPKTVDITLPSGDKVTVQKGPNGYVLPTVQGMPAPDPNAPQPPPGVDAKEWRKNRATQLSNIDDKEVKKAEDAVQAGTQAVESLTKALTLSKTALYGPLAGKVGYGLSLFGNKAGEDTEKLSSVVTTQALENLRSIFGGNPTEGERTILLQVQGAVNQAPAVREEIYKNAIEAANKRIDMNKRTAEQMRAGTYLLPEAQRNAAPGQPAQQPAQFNWKTRETIMGARQNAEATIAQAKEAVAKGMPPAEAMKRLQAAGIPVDPATFGGAPSMGSPANFGFGN